MSEETKIRRFKLEGKSSRKTREKEHAKGTGVLEDIRNRRRMRKIQEYTIALK